MTTLQIVNRARYLGETPVMFAKNFDLARETYFTIV